MARERITRRRALALWGLGIIGALHAALYIHIPNDTVLPAGLRLLDDIVPLWVVAVGWGVAAVPMLYCAITRRPGWGAAALTFIMLGIWGTAYAAGVIWSLFEGDPVRSLLLAGLYAALQLIMLSVTPPRKHEDPVSLASALPLTVAMLEHKDDTNGDSE